LGTAIGHPKPGWGRMVPRFACFASLLVIACTVASLVRAQEMPVLQKEEGDFIARDFRFHSGEVLPELKLHYTTVGQPAYDARGQVTNAVLILHGTGGFEQQFLVRTQFAGILFVPGGILDLARYFIILPDGIGHGKSSKPSDGLHVRFPRYDYDDMVQAQYRLLTEGLKVPHLRLILGTSMGCMHTFVWGETHSDFMDALMPLACLPVQIAGRNLIWREMVMDAIRNDPAWKGGEYVSQPREALRTASDILLIASSAPRLMQKTLSTRDAVAKYLDERLRDDLSRLDANDLLYQVNASRNYDPSAQLGNITAPVTWVNSADDFINPPELGIAEEAVTQIKNGRFVLRPIVVPQHNGGGHIHHLCQPDRAHARRVLCHCGYIRMSLPLDWATGTNSIAQSGEAPIIVLTMLSTEINRRRRRQMTGRPTVLCPRALHLGAGL
jgi:homoserine O-acetyltransferase